MRVAAIDCGTNAVRLLVADVPPDGGDLVVLTRRTQIVRLGEGVDRTGLLLPAALERARSVLARYGEEVRELAARRIRVVATSAIRDASNAGDFHQTVLASLGVAPEVISGDEEARLSFLGATLGLPDAARPPYLVVDIGGGSTEFVLGGADPGTATTVSSAASVDVGAVRLTERHLASDPPTVEQIAAAQADADAAITRALTVVPLRQARTLVAVAGTAVTVAALLRRTRDPSVIHHARLGYTEVVAVADALLAATHEQRLAMGVHPGRVDVIGAGVILLRAAMHHGGVDLVVVSVHDILDGIARTLADPQVRRPLDAPRGPGS